MIVQLYLNAVEVGNNTIYVYIYILIHIAKVFQNSGAPEQLNS